MQKTGRQRAGKIAAHRLFFPAAAIHAAVILPLSLAAMTSGWSWLPGPAMGHGREMLFGFALALVTGYLLGPQPKIRLLFLFLFWVVARLAWIGASGGIVTYLLDALFLLPAAWFITPKLLAAKKWRNRIIAPLIVALFLLPLIAGIARDNPWPDPLAVRQIAVTLLSLLMAFMGGRILSAAAAGEFYRQGDRLQTRVQPQLEAAVIVLLFTAAVFLPDAAPPLLPGLCLLAAGIVTGVRLARWRLWHCRHRPDLVAIGIGYAWLAAGMTAMGIALLTDAGFSNAMHVITIGALGTLSIGIAARVHLQKTDTAIARARFFQITTILIACATLLRLLTAVISDHGVTLLWASAIAWSLAYLLLAILLLGSAAGADNKPATGP